MQEDIDHRAVALVINTTKMTGRALKSAITKYLAHCRQKAKVPPTGRQTVRAVSYTHLGTVNEKLKKTAVRLLPYLFVALAATCLGKAWRMAEDADATQTLLNLPDALGAAFSPPIPSLHPFDP